MRIEFLGICLPYFSTRWILIALSIFLWILSLESLDNLDYVKKKLINIQEYLTVCNNLTAFQTKPTKTAYKNKYKHTKNNYRD